MNIAQLTPLRVGLVLLVCMLLATAIALSVDTPPEFSAIRAGYTPSAGYLLDRHGEVLEALRLDFGVRRSGWTPLQDVSPALISAVIEGEDRSFWRHHGVDWRSALGALRDEVLRHRRRGASTITMQLATLLKPSIRLSERGWRGKLAQVRLARGLERRWTKSEILEAYLNLLQFRGELQGIGAASAVFAGKDAAALSTAEGDVLAALLPSPRAPADRVAVRACARAAHAAVSVPCAQLINTATQMLARDVDAPSGQHLAPQLARALLKTPGARVRSTLDRELQRTVHEMLERQLAGLAAHNVRDGAAIVVDNASGEVLAYVGSAGLGSRASQVDGVRARRQAGSTLKPFLYELAFERGYLTPASLLDDSAMNVTTAGGLYLPRDYEHDFKGPVSVRTALGGSLNVPAVRALVLTGVEPFHERLLALGYAGLDEDADYYGYSLALGSAEVSLWEQAQAYRTLARGGLLSALTVRAGGRLPAADRVVLSPAATFLVADILSDRAARVVTFGLDNQLNTAYWSAAKTGTSKDMRDNWCVGFSALYTVAVWVGNFEGDPMHDVSGVTGAAPVWREVMDALHVGVNSVAPNPPPGVAARPVEFAHGIEPPRREWFAEGSGPRGPIDAIAADARAPRIANPSAGMVVAIDPDIPPDRQRLPILIEGSDPSLLVRINERLVGHARDGLLWAPRAGTQHLRLETAAGQVLDQVDFRVR